MVVHELAHQWFGDHLAVDAWQHIWLNEGFATYAEWLWSDEPEACHRAGDIRLLVRRAPGGRPVLVAADRRPGPGPPLRLRGLRPRGDDVPPAPARGRRRRLLHGPAGPGRRPTATAMSPTASSSLSRSRSPGNSSTACSRPGSSPRPSRCSPRPRPSRRLRRPLPGVCSNEPGPVSCGARGRRTELPLRKPPAPEGWRWRLWSGARAARSGRWPPRS